MPPSSKALSPEIAALAADFKKGPRGLEMEKKRLSGWHQMLKALPGERHPQIALELNALAAKFRRLGGAATAPARVQLAALAALLLAGAARSRTDSSFSSAPPPSRKKR